MSSRQPLKRIVYKKKSKKSRPKLNINRQITTASSKTSAFPDRMFVKLKYATTMTLTSSTGSKAAHWFRVNSFYDPDYTGAGHQPVGYDNWNAIYGQSRVHAFKIKVSCVGVTAAIPGVLSITTNQNATATSDITDDIEQNRAKYVCVGGYEGQNSAVLEHYQTISSIAGMKLGQNSKYIADATNVPSESVFAAVKWQAMNLGSTTACNLIIELQLYGEFFGRTVQQQN